MEYKQHAVLLLLTLLLIACKDEGDEQPVDEMISINIEDLNGTSFNVSQQTQLIITTSEAFEDFIIEVTSASGGSSIVSTIEAEGKQIIILLIPPSASSGQINYMLTVINLDGSTTVHRFTALFS